MCSKINNGMSSSANDNSLPLSLQGGKKDREYITIVGKCLRRLGNRHLLKHANMIVKLSISHMKRRRILKSSC